MPFYGLGSLTDDDFQALMHEAGKSIVDSAASTTDPNALRGRLMTNVWFVDNTSPKVCTNYWANVVVMDITGKSEGGYRKW